MPRKVHIFWDNSNIFVPAKDVAASRDGFAAPGLIRIQFDNLYKLATGGRTVARAVCVGSVPPELEAVWKKLRATGLAVELFERGAGSRKEQAIDQALQVHMLRALADVDPPEIAVLLTGDGAGYLDGVGYHADLERMAKRGWGIEVLSWDHACNGRLKGWAAKTGVYIPLEAYYDSITFLGDGTRKSKPISLTRRPKVP